MFVFQIEKQLPGQKKAAEMGTPVLSLKTIKDRVDNIFGPYFCTDEMAEIISKQKNASQYIQTLITAKNAIAKAAGKVAGSAFYSLRNPDVGRLFAQNPSAFVKAVGEIAKAAGEVASEAFYALSDEDVLPLLKGFIKNPEQNRYFLMLRLLPKQQIAIELGRPLDDLHEKPKERQAYLDSISTLQTLSLLLSNPEYFYTSSNHMLIDRLKKDLQSQNLGISDWLERNNLVKERPDLCRNLLFRLINYDRFYGRENSLLSKKDFDKLGYLILDPLTSAKSFDPAYYYLLANSLDAINKIGMGKQLLAKMDARLKAGADAQTKKAFDFIRRRLSGAWDDPKVRFQPEFYHAKDGKLQIVQIFDKNDTEKDHWKLTQKWAAGYGKPKKGPDGELICENKDVRIILFMGNDGEGKENQAFLKKKLAQDPNMILTFRGHSFSLKKNMSYGIFGNINAHILFIPGSCGSSGSVPSYMVQNQNTDLRTASNTSTGRGQVTNELLGILVKTRTETKFGDILKNNAGRIEKAGGDAATIKVWSEGEALLDYVYHH